MKLSLSIFEKEKPAMRTGAVIQHAVIQPQDAKILRENYDFNRKQVRMYDAAVTNNLNADFPLTVGSPNAEVLTSLNMARGRYRTLKKDFPTGKGIVRAFRNNVCGDDPFRLEMKVGKKTGKTFNLETDTNQMIQDAWDQAGRPENCTVRGDMSRLELYHAVIASALTSGNILVRHHRDYPDNEFQYAVELIASDRLQENYMGKAAVSGNVIRFSVERNKYNRAIAYWILTRHPGDLFAYNGTEPNTMRERVPAKDIILFCNIRDEPEQDIGMTEFDSIIQSLHRDRQFDIAHVYAAVWNCANPYWLTKEQSTGMLFVGDPIVTANYEPVGNVGANGSNGLAPGDGKGGGADKVQNFEPGTGRILDVGVKPMQTNPKFPIEAASTFKRDNMLAAATGSGISLGSVSSNYENYSFSTARAAQIPERDNFKVYQQHMILSFVRPHFEAWLKNALVTGAIDLPISRYDEFCKAANFHPKRWPYINPLQDVQADVIGMEVGLKSPQEVLMESDGGRSIEDVYSDIAAAKEMAEGMGLDFSEDATIPTLKKGEPGQTQQPANGQELPDGATPPGKKSRLGKMIERANTTLMLNGDRH